jgi:hypothetical protein
MLEVERCGKQNERDLLPRLRWILEIMISDRLTAFKAESGRNRVLLEPLLTQLRPNSDLQPDFLPMAQSETDPDLKTVGLALFEQSTKLIFRCTRFSRAPIRTGPAVPSPPRSPILNTPKGLLNI